KTRHGGTDRSICVANPDPASRARGVCAVPSARTSRALPLMSGVRWGGGVGDDAAALVGLAVEHGGPHQVAIPRRLPLPVVRAAGPDHDDRDNGCTRERGLDVLPRITLHPPP